jgi:hypothetical protein
VFYAPGEHDTSVDDGKAVHGTLRQECQGARVVVLQPQDFVGLSNVVALEGLGRLGREQRA